ncbi:retrotransposon ORF1 [Tanacetum coccineum]
MKILSVLLEITPDLATRAIETPLSSPWEQSGHCDTDSFRVGGQNGYSFHGLCSEDPNQHLKDFLKLMDSLDLDVENRERMRLSLFQFSFRDQASNWLKRLAAGSISTWEDLTTRFLAQFVPSGRTAKLRNEILMFQQYQGESLSKAWTRLKELLQKLPHHGIDLWLQSTSDRRLIELENQVQCLMETHLAPKSPTQVKKSLLHVRFAVVPTTLNIAWKITSKFLLIIPSWKSHSNLRNPIIVGGCPSNLKIPCNIGHVHVEKAYIDLNSPINVMSHMQFNWFMRKQLEPREDPNGIRGVSNFTGRVKGMHIFVGNFSYVLDFMIVEDISSIIDPRFTNGIDEIAYKMPHKIEQFNSLSDLEKVHTKLVYFRNEEDKRRGVDYVMSKILGFYKGCLELGPEYLSRLEEEDGVTLYLMGRSFGVLRRFIWTILG